MQLPWAVLSSVVDAFDEEFEDAGLVAGGEGFPGLVEVGEEVGDFAFVDLIGSECGEFAVDLRQAAFGGAELVLQVGELGDSLGGVRQAGGGLQIGVVRSQLLLEQGALLGQVCDAVFGLEPDLPDGLGDQLGIGANLVDLVDHETFDFTCSHRRSRALISASPLGGAAEVILVSDGWHGLRLGEGRGLPPLATPFLKAYRACHPTAFAQLKAGLRRLGETTLEGLIKAVGQLLDETSAEHCLNFFFLKCGYG